MRKLHENLLDGICSESLNESALYFSKYKTFIKANLLMSFDYKMSTRI